jgi:alpha-galactosidase
MRISSLFFFFLIFLSFCLCQKAQLAGATAKGWNSYDAYDWSVNEIIIMQHADYMAEHMLSSGFNLITIDFYWYLDLNQSHIYLDEYGRPQPDPRRFPSGFRALGNYIHSRGLLFGLHVMRGISQAAISTNKFKDSVYTHYESCNWYEGDINVGKFYSINANDRYGLLFLQSLYDQYANEWGVDFIKLDCVYGPNHNDYFAFVLLIVIFLITLAWLIWGLVKFKGSLIVLPIMILSPLCIFFTIVLLGPLPNDHQYALDQIIAVSQAIDRTNRSMLLSISPGQANLETARQVMPYVDMFRISSDFWDEYSNVVPHFQAAAKMEQYISSPIKNKKGRYVMPDLDILPFGFIGSPEINGPPTHFSRFTQDEMITILSLWMICKSPLMYGGDLLLSDEFSKSLLLNPEALEINSNSTHNRNLINNANFSIWTADHQDINTNGIRYLSIHNLGENNIQSFNYSAKELLTNNSTFNLSCIIWRDIWNHQDVQKSNIFSFNLRAHQSMLLSIRDCQKGDSPLT